MTVSVQIVYPSTSTGRFVVKGPFYQVNAANNDEALELQNVIANDFTQAECLKVRTKYRAGKDVRAFMSWWMQARQLWFQRNKSPNQD